MDELAAALNAELQGDFPNAKLKLTQPDPRPAAKTLAGDYRRPAMPLSDHNRASGLYNTGHPDAAPGPTLLASIEETHKALTITLSEVSQLTEQLTGSAVGMLNPTKEAAPPTPGVLPHIHDLARQMQAMSSSIVAMVADIRGRL